MVMPTFPLSKCCVLFNLLEGQRNKLNMSFSNAQTFQANYWDLQERQSTFYLSSIEANLSTRILKLMNYGRYVIEES